MNAEDRTELHRTLIEGAAAKALNAAGCIHVDLFLPAVTAQLRAIEPGEGDPVRIYATDASGAIREGSRGPMVADDVVRELKAKPDLAVIGWTP